MENLQMLVSIGSLIGVFIAIWNVYRIKEAAMQDEGKRQQEQRQLAQMLAEAQHKIAELEGRIQQSDVNMAEIKVEIKHISAAVQRIEPMVNYILKLDDTILIVVHYGTQEIIMILCGKTKAQVDEENRLKLIEQVKLERQHRIEAVQWRKQRYQDELALGIKPTEPIEPILVYIQELRDITKQKEFPNNIIWPEEPK